MKFEKAMFWTALLTAATALAGDFIGSKQKTPWAIAIVDNFTHFLIGCFTWLSVATSQGQIRKECLYETFLCGVMAALIDLDHFISAGSWHLHDATSIKHRPFLHCTSLLVFVSATLILTSYYTLLPRLWDLGWILAAASITHHVRDAARRGFWLWPFGSTWPLPYFSYIVIMFVFPLFLPYLQNLVPMKAVHKTARDFLVV